tara:strand:+ start:104 stop:214 length:111 start_codon:yes stop_codon:yes gene_type:complete
MKETHGTVGLVTDYHLTPYIEKAEKAKDVKPLTKWR